MSQWANENGVGLLVGFEEDNKKEERQQSPRYNFSFL